MLELAGGIVLAFILLLTLPLWFPVAVYLVRAVAWIGALVLIVGFLGLAMIVAGEM